MAFRSMEAFVRTRVEVGKVDSMTPEQEREFWTTFAADLDRDDGAAARAHLEAGNPIYIRTATTPAGVIEKLYPDGRRELVRFDREGEHFVSELGTS
jgi:hypothetical protein